MPTAAWTPQQLRNAFPENHCSGYLLHDRDAIFASVATISAAMKIQAVRTAPRSAWQKRLRECVSALLDGAGLGAPQTTAPFDVKWDSRTVPNGTHSITAIATDTSGNAATASASVSLDNRPMISAVSATSVNPSAETIAWTSSESGGNGVYRYSSSVVFPGRPYNSANYWVDVVFVPE